MKREVCDKCIDVVRVLDKQVIKLPEDYTCVGIKSAMRVELAFLMGILSGARDSAED